MSEAAVVVRQPTLIIGEDGAGSSEVSMSQFGQYLREFDQLFVLIAMYLTPDREVAKYDDAYLWEKWIQVPSFFGGVTNYPGATFGLRFKSISMASPISIVLGGGSIVWALVLATIFSGGEVKLGLMEFRLPPLGTGLEALLKALGKQPGRPEQPPRGRDAIQQ